MFKINISHRDTVRRVKWLDFENSIYDEDWQRVYTIFGIFKFNLGFKQLNNLDVANYKLKSKAITGFESNNKRHGK